MNRPRPSVHSLGVAVLAAVVLGAALVGASWAAPAQFLAGGTEVGEGADVGESSPAYFVWQATQIWQIPATVPSLLSSAVATPTRLAAAAALYTIDSATKGNTSIRWTYEETTTAPTSTELELRFTAGLARTAVALRLYVETQATAPLAALTFLLFWDAGAFAPAGITVETMQVSVLVCTSVGHCP